MSTAEEFEVWGINVPISPKGRRKYPQAIRDMAVKRVIDGAKIIDISKEIRANNSLVHDVQLYIDRDYQSYRYL